MKQVTTVTWEDSDTGCDVESKLSWSPEDPLMLTVTFPGAETVQWKFARDVMQDAAERGDAGLADVRVTWGNGIVVMTLSSDHGYISLVSRTPNLIGKFLDRTYSVVPRGEETIDIDALIAGLLGG